MSVLWLTVEVATGSDIREVWDSNPLRLIPQVHEGEVR